MAFRICEKRQAIIEAPSHCLVLGGPGSGKTTLGLLKALRQIEGLRPGQAILFLSFSRAAVVRITKAAVDQLPRDKQNLVLIQTFHSFFWQILQAHAYLLGCPRRLQVIQSHEEVSLRNGITPDQALLWTEWERSRFDLFLREGRTCFDLFAPLAARLFTSARRLTAQYSRRFPLIVVDEAQDTNEDQWACVQSLSTGSQIVCLADPDQMIYGHLPGVTVDRMPRIRAALQPLEVDLGGENNRSPGTDIALFAKDVYRGTRTQTTYRGLSQRKFDKNADKRDSAIRASVGMLLREIKRTGEAPKSIAVLASYARGVAVISSALQQEKAIPHQVLFDESFALLSARAAAFLLEPKREGNEIEDAATLLDLAAAAHQSRGTASGRNLRDRLVKYAGNLRGGKIPAVKVVAAANTVITGVRTQRMSGDPRKDWGMVKRLLQAPCEETFGDMASELDYLVAFGRGRRIAEGLSSVWLEHGAYLHARSVLDSALLQDQLLAGAQEESGIYVMNTHKAKGKQFDGVVLYRQEYHSPFVWRNEKNPFRESRRLLHMAITRARKHVLILSEAYPACPLLRSHGL